MVSVDDNTDEWIDNGCESFFVNVKNNLFMKKLFMEYFTGESCGSCPRVGMFVDRLLNEHPLTNRIISTEHHTYGKDFLAIPESSIYAYFFNVDGAPWLLFDRQPEFLFCPTWEEEQLLWEVVDYYLKAPTSLYLQADAFIDNDTRKVTVNVFGEKNEMFSSDDPRVSIFVVSDTIHAKRQYFFDDRTGKTYYLLGEEYIHYNPVRKINDKWGVPISFEGNTFSYQYSFEMDPKWKLDNTSVIIFVSGYNSENNIACKVENAESISLRHAASSDTNSIGIGNLQSVPTEDTFYYDITGRRLDKPQKGFYIEHQRHSDGKVKTIKRLLK